MYDLGQNRKQRGHLAGVKRFGEFMEIVLKYLKVFWSRKEESCSLALKGQSPAGNHCRL